jgi:hypothetical protein
MQYRIECIQTVFGEERERRLKQMFDIILSLGSQKPGAENGRSNGKESEIKTITEPTDETEGESKENENMLVQAQTAATQSIGITNTKFLS